MQTDHHDHGSQETKALFQRAAIECAAAPVQSGYKQIDGAAVISIICYAKTLTFPLSDRERLAIVGQAFDIFAAAVRREQA